MCSFELIHVPISTFAIYYNMDKIIIPYLIFYCGLMVAAQLLGNKEQEVRMWLKSAESVAITGKLK